MAITVTSTSVVPSDTLIVYGRDSSNNELQGQGWVSATTNWFPTATESNTDSSWQDNSDNIYYIDGSNNVQRYPDDSNHPNAHSREMTQEEKNAYYLQVLVSQNPDAS